MGSLASDRLVDPVAAAEESELGDCRRSGGVQKKLADTLAQEAKEHPDQVVEVWAMDEHRIGLKPIHRRVWAIIDTNGSTSPLSWRR